MDNDLSVDDLIHFVPMLPFISMLPGIYSLFHSICWKAMEKKETNAM